MLINPNAETDFRNKKIVKRVNMRKFSFIPLCLTATNIEKWQQENDKAYTIGTMKTNLALTMRIKKHQHV